MLHLALGLYASPLCISDALALLNSQALLNAVANTASFADPPRAGAPDSCALEELVQEFLFDVHNSYGLSEPTGEKRKLSLSKSFFIYTLMSIFCLRILYLPKPNILFELID